MCPSMPVPFSGCAHATTVAISFSFSATGVIHTTPGSRKDNRGQRKDNRGQRLTLGICQESSVDPTAVR